MSSLKDKISGKIHKIEIPMWLERIISPNKPILRCPICHYNGLFHDTRGSIKKRNSRCPQCRSTERVRLLWLVLDAELPLTDSSSALRTIHFAPEDILRELVRNRSGTYETSSFDGGKADYSADLRALPFEDGSYDVVIASHVLEHIKEDMQAIKEIHRILAPGGKAFLPVPMTPGDTEEYDAPRPAESFHVRGPGLDYFDRYRTVFEHVTVHSAEDYDAEFQLIPDMQDSLGYHYIPVCKKRNQ